MMFLEALARFTFDILLPGIVTSFYRTIRKMGGHFFRMLGGFQKPLTYYTVTDNFGIGAFLMGVGLMAGAIFFFVKIVNWYL